MDEQERALANEDRLVWLEDPARFPYVRQSFAMTPRRKGMPAKAYRRGDRLVGYAELKPFARPESPGGYYRRIFWLKTHDRNSGHACYRHSAPCEAVDPATVQAGLLGTMTDAAWLGAEGSVTP